VNHAFNVKTLIICFRKKDLIFISIRGRMVGFVN